MSAIFSSNLEEGCHPGELCLSNTVERKFSLEEILKIESQRDQCDWQSAVLLLVSFSPQMLSDEYF